MMTQDQESERESQLLDFIVEVKRGGKEEILTAGGDVMRLSPQLLMRAMMWVLNDNPESRAALEQGAPQFFDDFKKLVVDPDSESGNDSDNDGWRARLGLLGQVFHAQVSGNVTMEPDRQWDYDAGNRIIPTPRPRYVCAPQTYLFDDDEFDDDDQDAESQSPSFRYVSAHRRTVRGFSEEAVPREAFESALVGTFGIQDMFSQRDNLPDLPYKSFMSAGGLHELWPTVVIYRVEGIESGVYAFNDSDNTLSRIADAPSREDLRAMARGQKYADDCAFALILVSDLGQIAGKYTGPCGYKLALVDAGCALQMFGMSLTAVGLGGVPAGAIDDHAISSLLLLSDSETPLFMFFCGCPSAR
jgi:SagB-type dehydrogenase family enzyme